MTARIVSVWKLSGGSGGGGVGDRRSNVSATAREEVATENTQIDLCPLPNWTLYVNRRECADMMDAKRFDVVAVDNWNIAIFDRNCFKRDTALSAWK